MTDRWTLARYREHVASASQEVHAEPSAAAPKHMDHEYGEQVCLFAVVEWLATTYPGRAAELEDVYSTSSGGHRSRAAAGRMKEAGQRRGVPDIEVWVPRGEWHGLVIELKPVDRGRLSHEQASRLERLRQRGYRAMVLHGWIAALHELCRYLDIPVPGDPEAVAATVLARRSYERRAARMRTRH